MVAKKKTATKRKPGVNKGGRPMRVLTNEEINQVEALASYLSMEMIADYLEMGRNTLTEIMRRQPDVSVRYKKGKAKAVGVVANGLIAQARSGNTAAAIFYLKTQAGWREKEADDTAADHHDDRDIRITVLKARGDVKITRGGTNA